MDGLLKYTLEYNLKTSPRLLYTLISTPEGLSRWFADEVLFDGDIFRFKWEGSEQTARLVKQKENEYVEFLWLDDFHKDHTLEMRISFEPVSSELALIITDYAEPDDLEFSELLWNTQVKQLQRIFSS